MKSFQDEKVQFVKTYAENHTIIFSDVKQDMLINMENDSKIRIKRE